MSPTIFNPEQNLNAGSRSFWFHSLSKYFREGNEYLSRSPSSSPIRRFCQVGDCDGGRGDRHEDGIGSDGGGDGDW